MTRDEVLENIHQYAQWMSWIADDGCRSSGPSAYKEYLAKFAEGMRDLLRGDGLVPAEEITAEVFYRYQHMNLWAEADLLKNPDPRIRRDVEYDIAYRSSSRKARDAWHTKWADPLPGDEVTR